MNELINPNNWRHGIKRVWPHPDIKNWSDYCKYRFWCKNYITECDHCKYAMANFYESMNKTETMKALKDQEK